jgi:predicted phage replisome organizer
LGYRAAAGKPQLGDFLFLQKGGVVEPTETQFKTDSKRYYWLKLPTNFFYSDDVRVILAQQGGDKYVVFWLKLLLKALEQEEIGILRYKSDVPYTPELLAAVTDTDPDVVRSALVLFMKAGLIAKDSDGAIIVDSVHGFVGSVSDSAIRMRRLRERKRAQLEAPKVEASQSDSEPSQSDVEKRRVEKKKSREKTDAASQLPPQKREYAPKVFLAKKEYDKLCKRFGPSTVDSKIEDLSCYLGNNVPIGKYKDHYLTLTRWLKKDIPIGDKPKSKPRCPECGGEVLGGICIKCGWSKARPAV